MRACVHVCVCAFVRACACACICIYALACASVWRLSQDLYEECQWPKHNLYVGPMCVCVYGRGRRGGGGVHAYACVRQCKLTIDQSKTFLI